MPSNLAIDDKLLNQAYKMGGFKSKKDTVNEALATFIKLTKRQGLLKLAGMVPKISGYHYKKSRSK